MKKILIALGCALSALTLCARVDPIRLTVEDFDGGVGGSALEELPGWSRETPPSDESPMVLPVSGYHGYGVRFRERQARYRHPLSELPPGAVVREFRFKLRVMAANDAWTGFMLILGQEGAGNNGVSGIVLRFMGGKRDGMADNFIRVSTGGRSWSDIQSSDLAQSRWRKERWYEVTVSEINLDGVAQGETAARLRVDELGPEGDASVLVADEPIGRVGATSSFTRIDMFVMGTFAVNREVDVDEIELVTYTEE